MRSFKEIKFDYRFADEHAKLLMQLNPLMEEQVDNIMSTLNLWIRSNKGVNQFFNEITIDKHISEFVRPWFLSLFSGAYDNRYYEKLIRIGATHVRHGVDSHYMNRAINLIKNACVEIIQKMDVSDTERVSHIIAVGKILDINLDVMTTSYIEEGLRVYSPTYKVRSLLVAFSERFSQATNLLLVIALIGLTIGVVWLFVQDVRHLFAGDVERGIISALGSMLLLWLMIELMNTEISHLKGGKFRISIFVGVALVTMIRETMIATLKHEKPESIYYLIAAILVIGFVYWIVTQTEDKKKE
jgi:uncharacterized membrane protein (DUF373 family)